MKVTKQTAQGHAQKMWLRVFFVFVEILLRLKSVMALGGYYVLHYLNLTCDKIFIIQLGLHAKKHLITSRGIIKPCY